MSATAKQRRAPERRDRIAMMLTDDEAHAIRVVQAETGAKQIGNFCRDLVMQFVSPRFEALRQRTGLTREVEGPAGA